MIILCPRDKFMLVAECTVIQSRTLTWSFEPFLTFPVVITALYDLGKSEREGVTVVLIEKILAETASKTLTYHKYRYTQIASGIQLVTMKSCLFVVKLIVRPSMLVQLLNLQV